MKYNDEISEIANGAYLYEPSTIDIQSFLDHVSINVLPLPSNKKDVEAKIKDVAMCKTTGHSE